MGRLREDLNQRYVAKGESKENILSHEMFEVDGNGLRASTIGLIGGMLG